MKEYFLHDGTDTKGPMSLEELLKSGIQAETAVRHTGLEAWTTAKNLEELKPLFNQKSPPPFAQTSPPPTSGNIPQHSPQVQKSGKRPLRYFLILLVLLGIVLAVYIINKRNNDSVYTSTANYSESKMTVGEYEQSHSSEFLSAGGTYNEAIFSNKMKIHGTITNKATIANFKDIVIEVSYYSATKSLITKERFVQYDFVPAHTTKTFEWKIRPPGGTQSLGWNAVGGVAYR